MTATQRSLSICLPMLAIACMAEETPREKIDAQVDGKVWGAIVYAANGSEAIQDLEKPKPSEIWSPLETKIKLVCPEFKTFTVLGECSETVFRQYESWVVPTKDYFFKVDSLGPSKDADALQLVVNIWARKDVLLKTEAKLGKDSPYFFKGPRWRDGQLIYVLHLLEKE